MLGDRLSTNKSLTSSAREAQMKNYSRTSYDGKKKYRKKQKQLTEEQIEVFRQAFEVFDTNKSGVCF
jgi:Ca2+-binding EF-hand superfamily protein